MPQRATHIESVRVSRSWSLARVRLCCAVAAMAFLMIAEAAAQTQPPVFRSGTTIVEVTVIVRDRRGAFVSDLTVDDFEVTENGQPQRTQSLHVVSGPGASSAVAAAPGIDARPAGRAFVFLFDLDHLSPGGLTRARDAVLQFAADRLAPSDLAGMVATGGRGQGRVSNNHSAFAESVRRLKPAGDAVARIREMREWPRLLDEAEALEIARNVERVLENARDRACDEKGMNCIGDDFEAQANRAVVEEDLRRKAVTFLREARGAAQRSVAALEGLVRSLGGLPGRKTVVWMVEATFSDEIAELARQVAYRASQSGVAIYAIDPRGLARVTGGSLDAYAVNDIGMDAILGAGGDAVDVMVSGSGGVVIRNQNNLDRALRTIEDDTSQYYVLGYSAPESEDRSVYRQLRVQVRRPGVSVRARHGYMAPQRVTTLASADEGAAAIPAVALSPILTLPGVPVQMGTPEIRLRDVPAPGSEPAATGTSAPPDAEDTTDSVRLRPDASARIRELAGGVTDTGGSLASRGWEAYQRGDIEAAIGPLTEAAAEPSVRPWVLYTLGLAQVALGRPRDAIESWERVRQAAPEFAPVYIDLAATYAQLAELTKVLAVLRDAEARWPSDPEIHNGVGVVHVRRGALDDAIEAFSRAARAAPSEPVTYLNLGRAYELSYARSRRYVTSQRRWTSDENLRAKAIENYARCIRLGGPYAAAADEALQRLEWGK